MTPRASRPCWERRRSDPRQALRQREEEAPQDARADQGLPRRGELELQARQGGLDQGRLLRVPRPPQPQARLPPPVDHAHQRRRAPERHVLRRRSSTASSWPASSWTARSWPTSPCATPRRSADLPRPPERRRQPLRSDTSRHRDLNGRRFHRNGALLFARPTSDHLPPQPAAQGRPPARSARRERGRFVAEGEDLLAAADAAGWAPVHRAAGAASTSATEALAKVSGAGLGHARARRLRGALGARRPGRCASRCGASSDPGNVGTVLRARAGLRRRLGRRSAPTPPTRTGPRPCARRWARSSRCRSRAWRRSTSCPAARSRSTPARGEPLRGPGARATSRSSSAPSAPGCPTTSSPPATARPTSRSPRVAERRDGGDASRSTKSTRVPEA